MGSADGGGRRPGLSREAAAAWLPPARVLALQSSRVKVSSHLQISVILLSLYLSLTQEVAIQCEEAEPFLRAHLRLQDAAADNVPHREGARRTRSECRAYHISRQVSFK